MLVQVENVSKQYRNHATKELFTSLKNISLETDTNEFVCLLGPSGCGKSTILKLIAGLQTPDGGKIIVDGSEVKKPGNNIGVVFQDYALFPWKTVRKNISIGLDIKHVPKAQINEKVDWAIKLVGLEKFAEYYPHQLSGGMKQRVAIARALVLDSKVLLMDEPFGALDAFTRMNLQDDLIELWQKQKFAAIFVTHDVDEAVYLADRVIVMTPSPGEIKKTFKIELSRPRVRTSPDFNMYRSEILKQYGYVDNNTVEYQI
ncbi:MAG: ABC transporter ATP-binding protein [Oscillospiraceae bacterium]